MECKELEGRPATPASPLARRVAYIGVDIRRKQTPEVQGGFDQIPLQLGSLCCCYN